MVVDLSVDSARPVLLRSEASSPRSSSLRSRCSKCSRSNRFSNADMVVDTSNKLDMATRLLSSSMAVTSSLMAAHTSREDTVATRLPSSSTKATPAVMVVTTPQDGEYRRVCY